MPVQLLITKFFIPLLNARRVSRPRLTQRLSASHEQAPCWVRLWPLLLILAGIGALANGLLPD